MRVEKILQTRVGFAESAGPWTAYTIGFKVGNQSFILGEFYEGPHCEQAHLDQRKIVEDIVDRLVVASEYTVHSNRT